MTKFDPNISSVQQAHVQMHQYANRWMALIQHKKHAMIWFLKDVTDLLANGLNSQHLRLRKGLFSHAQRCVCIALASEMTFVIGADANWRVSNLGYN